MIDASISCKIYLGGITIHAYSRSFSMRSFYGKSLAHKILKRLYDVVAYLTDMINYLISKRTKTVVIGPLRLSALSFPSFKRSSM